MNKIYSLVITALAAFSLGTQTMYAESTVLTPTQTTKIQANGKTATNADVVLYDAEATSWTCSQAKISGGVFTNQLANYEGSPVVLTKFDASSTLQGKKLTKATLKFTSVCTVSGKNSNVQLAKVNTGWDATTATWNSTNTAEILNAVNIDEVDKGVNVKTTAKELTYDVTEYLKANTDNTIGFGIYTYTGREQKVSNISLTLEYIDASSAANVTIKYVDAEGNELKTSDVRSESIGATIELKAEDKASIYNEDKTVKYVYDSDDAAEKAVAQDGSTVITVKFRQAATWNYTFRAVDGEGNTLQDAIVKGSNFEGETFDVGYPYAINVDGTLYTSTKLSSDKKGYYLTFNLNEDNQVKDITFTATDKTGIVFLSEAENIEGLTRTTNANTAIRSSNGGSAFAAEDTEITKIPAGKYKLTSIICDAASSKPNSWWNYLAGNDTIFKQNVTSVNWAEGTSDEFTLKAETPIIAGKGGSVNAGIDLVYIQKTGDYVPETPTYPEGDVTVTYVVNLGFENCEAATGNVATDGSAQGTDYETAGWKLAVSSVWSNSAAFAYGSDAQLNGVAVPATDNAGNAGNALGFTVGWNGENSYKSAAEVTLPAGFYTLTAHAYNAGTATQFASKLGFVTADNTYASDKKDFALNQWVEDKVTFVLDAETTGHFTIGGKAVSGGSKDNGKVFFDNITLERKELLNGARATLADEIDAAKEVAAKGLAPKDALQAAITTAEGAAENTNYKDVLAAADALKAAVGIYNETNAHFVQLADVKAKYTFAADAYPYASAEKAQALATVIAKTPATADEADAQQTEVINAARAYVESNAKAEGVECAVDYTASIKNPNAESKDNWNLTASDGAKIKILNAESFTDAEGNANYSYFDGGNWGGSSWDVTYAQTVNLPKGKYLLTATSRASEKMSSFALFAGEQRTEMTHVGASGELFNRGWNDANVTFNVTEENADVNLGVQGITSETHQWMSFTRFRLVKVGDIVETPVVANFAALKDVEEGKEVKLVADKAVITYVGYGATGAVAYAQDATGAILLDGDLSSMLTGAGLGAGSKVKGELYVAKTTLNGVPALTISENTSNSNIDFEVGDSIVAPEVITVADAQKAENLSRYVKVVSANMSGDYFDMVVKQKDATMGVNDKYYVLPEEFVVKDSIVSLTGVIGLENGANVFYPTSANAIVTYVAPATVVENIGDLLKLTPSEADGIDVKLKLTDAKITVLHRVGGIPAFAMLEDATGGVQLSNWVFDVEENQLLDITLRDSVALNGYLYGNYNPGTLFTNDSTFASQFTVTPTTIVPKATTVAGLKTPDNNMRLVELKGISAGVVSGMIYLKQGDASIDASDLLSVFPVDENDQPIVPKKLESIDGILMYYAGEGTDSEYYGFVPTAYKEEVINPKKVEGNNVVFLPTAENVEAAKAEGWLKGGETRVDNKKGDIDPATGETLSKATAFPGLGLKKGNSAKSLTIYVTGVDKLVAYATNTSSSEDRAFNITAVNVDDESDSSTGAVIVSGNKTSKNVIELFDKDATYAITFEGLKLTEDGKPDYATGGDVALHGITFNPNEGGATGITNVNAASLLNKDVYSTNGTLVRKAGESLKGLSKGLYIIGGKKIVVK